MLSKAVVMDRILRLEFLCTGHQQVSTRNGRLSFVYTEKISTLKPGWVTVPLLTVSLYIVSLHDSDQQKAVKYNKVRTNSSIMVV